MLRRVCTFAGHAHDRMLVGIELGDVHKRVKSPLITSSTGALPLGLGSLARGRPTKIKVESSQITSSRDGGRGDPIDETYCVLIHSF
jgi:hypothetical protein